MKRLWVIAYDIVDDDARRRIEKYLLNWGDRVQYSVFEAYLSAREAQSIATTVRAWIQTETDSVRLYPLCAWCQERYQDIGQGRRSSDPCLIVL